MSAPDNTRETHKAGIEAARRAIHSGKGCTCRRGARGDAEDAIDAYLSCVRVVSLDAVLDALRNPSDEFILNQVRSSFDQHIQKPNTIQARQMRLDLQACAEFLESVFGAEDPQP